MRIPNSDSGINLLLAPKSNVLKKDRAGIKTKKTETLKVIAVNDIKASRT